MIKKLYRLASCIIVVVIFLFCVSGCSQKKTRAEEISLGVAWPFASDTSLFEEGINMAVEEINERGGIGGRKLTLLELDDASETAKGLAIAQSLSDNKSVMAVIGHKSSYVSVPASVIYEEEGLVMLSPASTAPELIQNDRSYIFRIIPSDKVLVQNMAEYLAEHNKKRIVIYYSDDSYGKGLADAIEDQSTQNGITVVDRFNYYSGVEELKRLQRRWKAFGYDAIFVALALSGGGQFIYDAGQVGISTMFVGGNALDSSKLSDFVGKQEQNIVIGSVFDPDSSELAGSFSRNFIKKYEKAPDMYAALGYDAVHIMAAAINNAKDLNRDEVASELRNLGEWSGVCGVHKFSASGEESGDLLLLKQFIDGTFTRLER